MIIRVRKRDIFNLNTNYRELTLISQYVSIYDLQKIIHVNS